MLNSPSGLSLLALLTLDLCLYCRYVNVSDEMHRLQSAVYLAVRGHGQPEDDPDYVHPVTGSR